MAPEEQQRHRDDDRDRRLGAPDQQLVERRERGRDQRGERRVAEERRDDDPGGQRRQAEPGVERQQHAGRGGHALAALEVEVDRPEVAEEGAEAGERGAPLDRLAAEPEALRRPARREHRHHALERVEKQRRDRRLPAARAQHVGGARVARAVAARVGQAHRLADDDRERERADQVAGQPGEERKGELHREEREGPVCVDSGGWLAQRTGLAPIDLISTAGAMPTR